MEKFLGCPHCGKDDIKYGVKVCSGCQAEITYGNSLKSFLMFAIVFPFMGFIGTLVIMEWLFTKDWAEFIVPITTELGLAVIIFIPWVAIFWKLNRKMYKGRTFFSRRYNR